MQSGSGSGRQFLAERRRMWDGADAIADDQLGTYGDVPFGRRLAVEQCQQQPRREASLLMR